MSRLPLRLLPVVLIAASCSSSGKSVGSSVRPVWLSCPAVQAGSLTALGVAAARPESKLTLELACESARGHLARSVDANVVSANLSRSWESGDWWEAASWAESGDVASSLGSQSRIVSTWTDPANGDGYCLVSIPVEAADDPCLAMASQLGAACRTGNGRPGWINDPPAVSGTLSAVGVGRRSAYRANLLETAITEAMAGLSRSLATRVSGLLQQVSGSFHSTGLDERAMTSSTRLQGARLMSWWLDPTTGDAFSLVCLPVAGVKIDVARMILREQEAADHQRESPKESPEEAHERLRKLLDDSL